jgi:hypothetical protein
MPQFTDLKGAFYSLPLKPPFAFEGLTSRVLPLRAKLSSLQRFCNSYLNGIPPEVGRFRAVVPYVYLMMLDYGKLAAQVANVGWIAQCEIYFGVPVEWYKVIDGKWIFHDWAWITPFVYVNDDLSVPLGRMVYGWPKTMARLTPEMSGWIHNPLASVKQATVSAMVFPELYEGRRLEERVFLEIERDAPMSNLRMPFDARSPIAPWIMASKAAEAMAGFGRDAAGLLEGLGLMPYHPSATPGNFSSMAQGASRYASSLGYGYAWNTLNLKQFRRSENPDKYCYQSLTNGPMRVTSYNGAGLLGEERIMFGDVSGGYSIKLHDWPSLPIVQTLGLEVQRRWKGDGSDVSLLKPVMPFWYNVNMEYQPGTNLAWRTHDGIWRDDAGRPFTQEKKPVPTDELLFNTTLASASDAIAGPFRFANTTIRVLPLLARRKTLETFLRDYLNAPLMEVNLRRPGALDDDDEQTLRNGPFRLWASPQNDASDEYAYVYLTATNYGDVTSKTNNIGDWADYGLSFCVPVKQYRLKEKGGKTLPPNDPDNWELCGVGLVPAFSYVDDTTAAVARIEVLGIPTTRAAFVSPENAWMSEGGSDTQAPQEVLRVDAEVLPAVGVGQGSRMQTIVDVTLHAPAMSASKLDARLLQERWGSILQHELERRKRAKHEKKAHLKNARAMAIELLGNRLPLPLFTMKQFRDVADADKACYQAIVRVPHVFSEVLDVREIEQPLLVRIHEFPTQPLVEMLGLVQTSVLDDGAGIVYSLQPVRPFSLRVTMEEGLGERLTSRSGTLEWEANDKPFASVFTGTPKIELGAQAGRLEDSGDARKLEQTTRDWKESVRLAAADPASHSTSDPSATRAVGIGELRAAVEAIEPQIVLESMLSREWGNWDEDARWQKGRRDLRKAFDSEMIGVAADQIAATELVIFNGVLALTGKKPGEPPVRSDLEPMISRLAEFSGMRAVLEQSWSVVASWGVEKVYGQAKNDRQTAVPTGLEALQAMKTLLKTIAAVSVIKIEGIPSSAVDRSDYAVRDNQSRLTELNDKAFDSTRKVVEELLKDYDAMKTLIEHAAAEAPPSTAAAPTSQGDQSAAAVSAAFAARYQGNIDRLLATSDAVREAIELVRERCVLQREAVFNKLSRAYQKPDYCIPRDAVGPEREHMFPMSESWDEDWYYGPDWTDYAPQAAEVRAAARLTPTSVPVIP